VPPLSRDWLPTPGKRPLGAVWHEVDDNWKSLALWLAQGAAGSSTGDCLQTHSVRADGMHISVLWSFPNLLLWRSALALCVIVLQPTAVRRTLCRLSVFATDSSSMVTELEVESMMAHLRERATGVGAAATDADRYCSRQVARHVLIARPGYQPGLAVVR
jgi:hypothetical protein